MLGRTTSTGHSSGRPRPMTTAPRPSTISRLSSKTSTTILVTPLTCVAGVGESSRRRQSPIFSASRTALHADGALGKCRWIGRQRYLGDDRRAFARLRFDREVTVNELQALSHARQTETAVL